MRQMASSGQIVIHPTGGHLGAHGLLCSLQAFADRLCCPPQPATASVRAHHPSHVSCCGKADFATNT